MEIVCCLRLGEANVYNHLYPLSQNPEIDKIWIIRHAPVDYAYIPKSEYVVIGIKNKWIRFLPMLWHTLRLSARKNVKILLNINPFPYGFFSIIGGKFFRKKIVFQLIGSDWNLYARGKMRFFLFPFLKSADLLLTSGKQIADEMIQYGFNQKKILIDSMGINIDNFPISNIEEPQYFCVSVGRLIPLKRVNLMIQVFYHILKQKPNAKFCIIGDGPELNSLKELTKELNIKKSVDFVGYQKKIHPYLSNAIYFLLFSTHEGSPLTLMEAVCTGTIPICTPVGSVKYMIEHNKTGLLVNSPDPQNIADLILKLDEDDQKKRKIKKNLTALRNEFSFETAYPLWNKVFEKLFKV